MARVSVPRLRRGRHFIEDGRHDSPPTPRLGQFRFDPNFVIYA
jgi:hypothetical protein